MVCNLGGISTGKRIVIEMIAIRGPRRSTVERPIFLGPDDKFTIMTVFKEIVKLVIGRLYLNIISRIILFDFGL